ncbi:935_t:CDS:2, partial [Ambispora gerdemannii]
MTKTYKEAVAKAVLKRGPVNAEVKKKRSLVGERSDISTPSHKQTELSRPVTPSIETSIVSRSVLFSYSLKMQ